MDPRSPVGATDSPQYQYLLEYVEAIEACSAALDQEELRAGEVDLAADQARERAPGLLADIETALKDAHTSFVEAMEAAEHAMEETAQQAQAIAGTRLPEAVAALEEVPHALDALIDPARADLVKAFETLDADGFSPASGALQAAATTLEEADDGSAPLQPFLELPADVAALAEDHETEQQQTAGHIDEHATALTAAGHACHDIAQAGAQTWGHECVEAIQHHCDAHAHTVRGVYTGWDEAAAPEATEVEQAIASGQTRLTDALDGEDRQVDHETEEAQTSLDKLHAEMTEAGKEMDEGESVIGSLADYLLPELAVAKGIVGKLKALADEVGT